MLVVVGNVLVVEDENLAVVTGDALVVADEEKLELAEGDALVVGALDLVEGDAFEVVADVEKLALGGALVVGVFAHGLPKRQGSN